MTECKLEYGPTASYGESKPCSPSPGSGESAVTVSASLSGLSAKSTYHFRVVAKNAGGESKGADETLKTLPNAPTVKTEKASEVAQTTAKLNASVNPNGGEVTECKLEYGPTASYGESKPCSPSPGSGESAVTVSASLSGLSAKSTYHFRVVAKNAGGESKGSDETFETLTTTSEAPTVKTEKASEIAQTTAKLNASVNPNGGEVTECKLEYGPTASYGESKPCSPSPGSGESAVTVSASLSGLSAKSTYHFRVVAKNAGGESKGSDETLKTLPNAPTVKTEKASEIAQTTAKLNASVNPNGGEVTECKLEYGPTASYGESKPCSPSPGSGESAVTVSASLSGLSAKSTYHFRVVAKNAGGESKGSDETLKTLPNAPTVKTEKASEIAQTTAKLNASVNPNGGEVTECKLEYGPTASYGESKPCSPSPGSGESAVTVSASISGLTANATYHFRIVAKNAGGESKGADETLKTTSVAPTVKTEKASEVAQTTAKLSATVNPNGGEVTNCEFEYVTAKHYEFYGYLAANSIPCSSLPGSGSGAVSVSATVPELFANTTYHFRIVAKNAGGESEGADETFKTLPYAPGAEAERASEITQTSAQLNGFVGPEGAETVCRFEYGTTPAYGSSKPCTPPPGSTEGVVSESAAVSGLSADTTYFFRIVAENAGGKNEGRGTFTTLPAPSCTAEGFCNNLSHFQGEASFSEPDAVALDPSGDIFVADSAKDQVLEFNSERKLLRQFGSEGSGEGQFKGIGAIASNSAGDVYVTDPGNHRVQEFGPSGEHLRSFGSSALKSGQLLDPTGIAIDSSGDVWVLNPAGASGDRIVEFSSEGGELTKFGANGSGEGQLGQAYGLAISGGNLYVSEQANSRVQELSTAGAFIRQFDLKGSGSGESNQPYAIATEAGTGDLYVTEVGSARVQVFSAEGAFVTTFGSPGSGAGQLSAPKGIAVGSSGKVFVADTANKRIEEWAPGSPPTYTTSIVHFQGEASFSEPNAVALDPSGDIYVGESANDQVLEFNPERKLLRQFGSEGSGEGQFKGIGGIASDSAGDVYVTDPGNHRVQEFGPAGEHLRSFGSSALKGGQLLDPTGIAIDSSGDVWVLNTVGPAGDRIVEFSSEGAELTKFGSSGSGEGQLGRAYGLAISGGNLYVSEEANSRVQELSTSGEFIRAFDEKGSGSGKSNQPYAIATEASTGDVYVTEVGSERVQVFSAEGAFLNTFGTPGSGEGQFSAPKGVAVSSSGKVFVADTGNERLQEWLAAP